jgi:hypothetical protein
MHVGPSRKRLTRILLWAAPLTWLGCGGGGTDIVLPSVSVTTATAGVELDPDGYSVTVDGAAPQAIGVDATVTVEQLSEGVHTATLSGLAANCAAADNPRSFTVQAGVTTRVDFAITCTANDGNIAVTTSTTGAGSDPDGFTLLLDGGDRGPIGATASVGLTGISAGTHTVGLTGLAANCQVTGDNPRPVIVTSGQTASAPIAVTCAASDPTAGTVEITTVTSGSDQDPNGYSVQLDGGATQPIGISTTITLANVPAGQHAVQLLDKATNCTVAEPNPTQTTVPAGGTARVTFTVTCVALPPGTGNVKVTATTTGSSVDAGYTVSVDGGTSQAITGNGTVTVSGLAARAHSVLLGGVATNCTVTGDNPLSVTITAGQTSNIAFAITCVATGPAVNLSIQGLYLTQSTQTLSENVPLVQDRVAYLRVFALADRANTAKPTVRVRFFSNGSVIRTLTLSRSASSTPTALAEGTLSSSWNQAVDASLIQPGVSILADVDPGNTVPESNETDNSFPASGAPLDLNVHAASVTKIRFVPIQQGDGTPGNVTTGNKDALIETARRIYPLQGIDTDVRAVYTTSTVLQPDGGVTWDQLLSDLDGIRVMEGSGRTYYGVVKLGYSGGVVGKGFVGVPTAVGTDADQDRTRVVAHELGHTWGQLHTPCGNPPASTIDPDYPYGTGIGVYGFDVTAGALKQPTTPDIMGYCSNPWISDYTYTRVLNFRETHPAAIQGALAAKEPTVLVWGRIIHGQGVLEPAFQVVTRPSLPAKPGPYSVEGIATDGTSLFSLSFDATEVADGPSGSRHFAFAVPMDQARAARLGSLRLTGPAGAATISPRVGALRQTVAPDSIVARREARGVALEWNASVHPMIMVRDPDTGEVLSFARGGKARVWTTKGSLDLVASDGVQSKAQRVTVAR